MNSVQIPECFAFLFEPARYHVIHGGRGSGKSVNVAKALLIKGAQEKHRILCCRELQASIKDSVHKLLSDEIEAMGLQGFYEIQNATIIGKNGTEFLFKGLRHSVAEVKSTQGITICWVEEAQMVSKASWEVLLPTVREDNSEFYITFNPILEEDETYKRFVISPPPRSIVRQVNWDQNPFFPEVLRQEMEHLKAVDQDAWLNVWEGRCRHALDGAVFAKEMREAELGDRIRSVPYNQAKPVSAFWDLGKRDMTSIWFAQVIGFEFRVIDFYENSGVTLAHYIKALQERPYTYDTMWMPHDADNDLLASERTIAQQMRAAGFKVRVVPRTSKANQIEAARSAFSQCWFDREKCADGLQHLRHYQYEVDPDTKLRGKEPMHDEHSHAADAFLYLGMALREVKEKPGIKPFTPKIANSPPRAGAWLNR